MWFNVAFMHCRVDKFVKMPATINAVIITIFICYPHQYRLTLKTNTITYSNVNMDTFKAMIC